MFEGFRNQESIFASNLDDNSQRIHGRRVSLPEYNSAAAQNPLALSQDYPTSESSEDQDTMEIPGQNSPMAAFSPSESNHSSQFSINRGALDKVYAIEKQKKLSSALNSQVVENRARRFKEQAEKQQDKLRLNEDFQKFNNEKMREKEMYKAKVQDYKHQLDVQKAIKMDLRTDERIGSRFEREFEVALEHAVDSPNVGYFSNFGRYIKNTPQKLNFNPITGVLKENPLRKNIFDGNSDYSWSGSNQRSFHQAASEKSKNLMGYGSLVINNK